MNKSTQNEAPASAKSQRIRDELWSTFFHEMDDLLEKLESQLLDIEKNLDSDDLIASLFRTMHTLKGTAGMMGLNNVETLAHKAEDIMDLVRAHEMELNPQIIDLMFSTLDSLKVAQTIITETRQDINGDQNIELIAALKASAVPTAGSNPSTAKTTAVDSSIWEQIHQECCEQLDQIESAALAFEKGDHASFDQLFRSLHSLKSAVDFAHLVHATTLVHRCEDLVGLLRDQPENLSKSTIDTVLAVTDVMRKMFDAHPSDSFKNKTTDAIDLSLVNTQPLLQQIDTQLMKITGNVFSEYTSAQLTNLTINSEGVMLNKKNPSSSTIDPSYWQDYFALINENLASLTQAVTKADTGTIADCREEMLFASKQLQLNAAIEALQAFSSTDNNALSQLNVFFDQLKQQLMTTAATDTPVNTPLDVEAFFDVIWKSLSSLRKIAQANPINTQALQEEVERLTLHCQHVSPLDIEANLQQWLQAFAEQPLDVIKVSGLINDLYTYFWDQEDQLNQGDGSLLQRMTPTTPAASSPTVPSTLTTQEVSSANMDLSLVVDSPVMMDEPSDQAFPEAIFIIDFLEAIHQQLPQVQRFHQDYLSTGSLPSEWFTAIGKMAHQSHALGFDNLTDILNHTLQTANQFELSAESLAAFEVQLFAQLCKIGEALPNGSRKDLQEIANLTTVFKQWHSENCFQELALFINHISELQSTPALHENQSFSDRLHAMQLHLQSLLFSCQYWQLSQCEQAVLLLIDLLHRAEVEPTRLTPTILQEILNLGQHLGSCFDDTLNGGEGEETAVQQWITQLTQDIQTHPNTQQVVMARRFCQSLHLPACLVSALNEDDYEKIGGAMMQQRALFLVYSDIEDDETLVSAFFDLLETPKLSVITNATDYIEQRSVFYFLVSSTHNAQQLSQALQSIDPSQSRLILTPLTLNIVGSNITPPLAQSAAAANASASQAFDQRDLADLDLLQQALGQLVSIKTHMQQSSEAIKNYHLSEDILQHLQPVMTGNQSLPVELQQYLHNYAEIIDQWMQSQEALNTVADQLQDSLKNLQQAPIQPLLERLHHWYTQQPASHYQLVVPTVDADMAPVMLNKTQIPALESALQQLMTACLHTTPTQADAHIHIQTHNNERGTQCSLLLSPGLSAEQQALLDFPALQPRLAEHNIRLHSQVEHDQLQQIHLMLEDDHRIIEGLIVAADDMHYVIPTYMIKRLVNRNDVELMSMSASASSKLVKVEQQLLPLSFFPKQRLQPNFTDEHTAQNTQSCGAQSILLVIESADKQQALLVDELLGFQQVVVTPLQGQLQQCRSFSGCCVLGKDKVAMVFDAATALQ